jgi:hypothetical protein
VLETRGIGANEGHVQLAWEPAPGSDADGVVWHYELQESMVPDFSDDVLLRYAGPQQATFVSGLADGQHYFRLRQRPEGEEQGWSSWSEPLEVVFKTHPMALAWTLFGTGGLLVAAVVVFLVVASARTRNETGQEAV